MDKNFGNNYDRNATLRFVKRWWKLLTIVFVVGFFASMGASMLITPKFKSVAVLFPSNSNRGSKAITAERYSMDFLDYGGEKDCEYAIQIMTSQSMMEDACQRFNLMEHYGIKSTDAYRETKLQGIYNDNITIKRTNYLGVEIIVMDPDPKMAADIANYIAENYDSISVRIKYQRSLDAYQMMQAACESLQNDIFALEDSLRSNPRHSISLSTLISDKSKELAEMQTRLVQTKVDLNYDYGHSFVIDKAKPADKKAFPKRSIITLLGAIGCVAICAMVLLIIDYRRKEEE